MSNDNFVKNITSKDINLSKNTILNMIKSSSIEDYKKLCENSNFIFPFIKERIIADFVKLLNEKDLKTVFEFSKIYCADFENLIVNSWLKFANEDLTDELLEMFDKGTNEQKAYCALYFKHVKDPLALEYLNKCAYSDFEPLKINCAMTLSVFRDKKVYEDMKKIIINSSDEFEKNSAYLFLSAYQGSDAVDFILNNCFSSPFSVQIIANLLDFSGFENIKHQDINKIIQIFSTLIEGYPEDISLDTVKFYNILDYIKLINSYDIQYAKNSLILAKEKFKEFQENDIYLFDLDKNSKKDIKEIYDYLNSLSIDIKNLTQELKDYNSNRFELAINVIQQLKLKEYGQILIEILKYLNETYVAKTVLVLKDLNLNNLIPNSIVDKIQNENIKALIQSCLK